MLKVFDNEWKVRRRPGNRLNKPLRSQTEESITDDIWGSC